MLHLFPSRKLYVCARLDFVQTFIELFTCNPLVTHTHKHKNVYMNWQIFAIERFGIIQCVLLSANIVIVLIHIFPLFCPFLLPMLRLWIYDQLILTEPHLQEKAPLLPSNSWFLDWNHFSLDYFNWKSPTQLFAQYISIYRSVYVIISPAINFYLLTYQQTFNGSWNMRQPIGRLYKMLTNNNSSK